MVLPVVLSFLIPIIEGQLSGFAKPRASQLATFGLDRALSPPAGFWRVESDKANHRARGLDRVAINDAHGRRLDRFGERGSCKRQHKQATEGELGQSPAVHSLLPVKGCGSCRRFAASLTTGAGLGSPQNSTSSRARSRTF